MTITISITTAEWPKRGGSPPDFVGESIWSARHGSEFARSQSALAAGRVSELSEKGTRVEKVRVGARKRRRGSGPAANMEESTTRKTDNCRTCQIDGGLYRVLGP